MIRKDPISPGEVIVGIIVGTILLSIIFIIGYIQNPDRIWADMIEAFTLVGSVSFCMLIFVLVFGLSIRMLMKIEERRKE